MVCVAYLRLNIFLLVGDVFIDSETLLVADFVNLKIKSTQYFECAHRDKLCVSIFIRAAHTYINICVSTVLKK
jgi:hypothetical protein